MGGGDIDIGGGDIRCLLRRRRLIWDARAAVAYRAMFSMLSAAQTNETMKFKCGYSYIDVMFRQSVSIIFLRFLSYLHRAREKIYNIHLGFFDNRTLQNEYAFLGFSFLIPPFTSS